MVWDNGLWPFLPDATKPSPLPVFTYHWWGHVCGKTLIQHIMWWAWSTHHDFGPSNFGVFVHRNILQILHSFSPSNKLSGLRPHWIFRVQGSHCLCKLYILNYKHISQGPMSYHASTCYFGQYFDGLAQDCRFSIANALEIQQSCTGPSKIWGAADFFLWSSIPLAGYPALIARVLTLHQGHTGHKHTFPLHGQTWSDCRGLT